MKRVCTQEERELLLKNKKQMLQGINKTTGSDGVGMTVVIYVVPIFIAFAVMGPFMVMYDLPWIVNGIGLTVVDFISTVILHLIFKSVRVKKETKAFLSQKNLSVNGATVVEVKGTEGFAYIEDDVYDENGKPIIIEYPSNGKEIEENEVGRRLIVMYDDGGSYQLIRMNDELRTLIPSYTADYPLAGYLEDYMRVPHPNMVRIEKEGRDLTDAEKKEYADLYVKAVQGGAVSLLKKAYIALFFIVGILLTLLNYVEDGIPFETSLPYAIIGYLGLGALFALAFMFGRWNIRRQGQFTYKQDVLFHSYKMESNYVVVITVYEWENGKPQKKVYNAGNVSAKTKFGTIIYKFKNKKGKDVLVNMESVLKNVR